MLEYGEQPPVGERPSEFCYVKAHVGKVGFDRLPVLSYESVEADDSPGSSSIEPLMASKKCLAFLPAACQSG